MYGGVGAGGRKMRGREGWQGVEGNSKNGNAKEKKPGVPA